MSSLWTRFTRVGLTLGLLVCSQRLASAADDDPKKDVKAETTAEAESKAPEDGKSDAKPDASTPAALMPGHSMFGEAFDEGPRQKAYLLGGTGDVHLEVTVKDPLGQKLFDQGLGQVHGFWYFEAERSFRQVAALDPDCAMAYWGMAMSNFSTEKRAKSFIEQAVAKKGKAGKREVMWIDALSNYFQDKKKDAKTRRTELMRALEDIVLEYPEELEAKAMLLWTMWDSNGSVPITSYEAMNALIGEVLAVKPLHPVHHYRIHMWDGRRASRALASAALCGQGSPNVAHMWHMPGHIYWKVQRYDDSAWQQEASARVDHHHMLQDRVMPWQIHNYAHNNEWLTRSLSHSGRVHDAVDLAKNMIELPRHPQKNQLGNRGSGAYFGRTRLIETLGRYEMWDETIALADTIYLEPTKDQDEQVRRMRLLGSAWFGRGDVEKGKEQIALLDKMKEALVADREKAVNEVEAKARAAPPEKKSAEEKKDAQPAAGKSDESKPTPTAESETKPDVEKSPDDKKPEEKPVEAKPAEEKKPEKSSEEKQLEDKIAKARKDAEKPFAGKLAPIETALNDLNGQLALANGDAKAALELFAKVKDLSKELQARLQLAGGDNAKAEQLAKEACDNAKNQVHPLANYAYVLHRAGKSKEAAEEFKKLRELSARIDLDVTAFRRLEPIAKEQGFSGDWRIRYSPPSDVGVRPDLNALGPFRWSPSPAPNWDLPDASGKTVSLKDYQGKPVIVLFYLGHGCLHCVEQMKKFAPMTQQFADAGISLAAISTDTIEDLKISIENCGQPDGFPFPLVSNSSLEVFKTYRTHDDFEDKPLHGAFLIDAQGLVRWQVIGAEPFTDAPFLLEEAKRLIRQPTN